MISYCRVPIVECVTKVKKRTQFVASPNGYCGFRPVSFFAPLRLSVNIPSIGLALARAEGMIWASRLRRAAADVVLSMVSGGTETCRTWA